MMDHLSPSVVGLLRGMLPDGWDYFEDNAYGLRCDGINISSQLIESSNDKKSGLRLITANKSIKISSLNPIMNLIKGHEESKKTSVYYFEVFVMSGDCAVGFVPAVDNNSHHHDAILHSHASRKDSISVRNCGHLIHHPEAEFPLLLNNSEQNGETIGCGIIFGTEPTYFFTHNGVRIDVEGYGINSRLSSLQTALVPTVALSNSTETFVRTNFGFHLDTPFLWNGEEDVSSNNNLLIISRLISQASQYGGPTIPPQSPTVSNLGGGMIEGGYTNFHPLSSNDNTNRRQFSDSIGDDSGGSLLVDELYPPPNFARGNTLSGAITMGQPQRPAIPPVVEYAASNTSIKGDTNSGPPPKPSWRNRRRASMPSIDRGRDGSLISAEDRHMIDTLRGRMNDNLHGSVLPGRKNDNLHGSDAEIFGKEDLPLAREHSNSSDEAKRIEAKVFGNDAYSPTNFNRGNSLGQRPIPSVVQYAALSSSDNKASEPSQKPSWRNRRRASMPTIDRGRDGSLISAEDRRMIDTLRGRMNDTTNGSAFCPPWLQDSKFKKEEELSLAQAPSTSSDEAGFVAAGVFEKASATDVEFEAVHVDNDDFDLDDVKELATELTRATSESGTNQSSISQLIAVCESKLAQLNDKITSSTGEDFGELLSVHDMVTEAVTTGKGWEKRRRILNMTEESNHSLTSITSSHEQTSTEEKGGALRDIFGLLCHLRGRKERTRTTAVSALLSITRRGTADEKDQILQSGGFSSLLTLFKSSAESEILMTLSALTVANLVPSYTEPVRNKDIMAVVDCLYYVVQSPSRDADAAELSDITPAEVFFSCLNAMTFVWMNYVEPKLCSSDTILDGEKYDRNCFEMQRYPRKRRSIQEDDDVDFCHLLNSFTSLAVTSAALDHNDVDGLEKGVSYGFADMVQSICAVEACRGLAMKEGVMKILLKWMRSKDNELELIAATALRDLAVSESSYTTGWVHSELLHDTNAIADIVERLNSPVLEVRRCMAGIVSCLSHVPHTRTAILNAEGIKSLGQVLATVNSGSEDDSVVNVAVVNSLLNLAICSGMDSNCDWLKSRSQHGCALHGIMESGAIESLSMSRLNSCKELRFLYSQLIRVITEARCTARSTQQFLFETGAVTILGEVLSSDADLIKKFIEATMAQTNSSDLVDDSLHNDFSLHNKISSVEDVENAIKELREALRGLCSMFAMDIVRDRTTPAKACSQFIKSGGVKSLQWVASMVHDSFATLNDFRIESRYVRDIQVDSCQALSSLCPILLSQGTGPQKWAPLVLTSLIEILKMDSHLTSSSSTDTSLTIKIDALQGMISLAECEALRTRIVDELMPQLFMLCEDENDHIADAALQVCVALGFSIAEIGLRWDAHYLGDKFVFMRSLLIQSMVRDEIRKMLKEVWTLPLKVGPSQGSYGLYSLFDNLCGDDDTSPLRDDVRKQFIDMYEDAPLSRAGSSGRVSSVGMRSFQRNRSFIDSSDAIDVTMTSRSNPIEDISLHALKAFLDDDDEQFANGSDNNYLGPHQYPLNEFEEEKDWILQHALALKREQSSEVSLLSLNLPMRVNKLLHVYFPSALIRDEVIPLHGLCPDASFDFQALCMPAGKYSSFRREGQMVSTFLQPDSTDCHCTLGFKNCSFALEFADSLLQTLYICPAIQGLSFSNDPPDASSIRGASYHEYEGSELVADLVRTLPSSISHLTFDDVLSNNAALSMVHNLQSMVGDDDEMSMGSGTVRSTKGFLRALAVMNSPHIKASTFTSLIETIQTPPRDGFASLFLSLHTLDLSGNELGDDISARILEMVFLPSSSHNIEYLDLSRNGIKEGHYVKRVLEECNSSKPKLKVLNMSKNDLGVGDVASVIVYSLADVLSNLTSLDLSSNFLTGEVLDRLGGALPFNSRLENLNVSHNRFQKSSLESLISMLDRAKRSSSRLSFLHLDGNYPALNSKQESMLSRIMIENRKRCISTHFEERSKNGGASIDESSTGPLSTLSEITFPKFNQNILRGRNMITVLFSAPLVWRDDRNNYYPIEMLDFELEKSLLWQCFTEASRNIDLSYDNATTDRLQAARTKGCGCLHYSGHGHPTHLTFEDGSGGIHWLEVDQLKDLILAGSGSGRPPFNFVFVSACHSFLAGQTFVDAGVPHVVCCQQEAQLMDNAALSFTRAFYLALALGRTVKESFEIGKQAVLNSPTVPNADVEMKKFLLLPEDGNHEVAVLNAEPVPEWPLLEEPTRGPRTFSRRRSSASSSSADVPSSEYKLPSLAQGFSGREVDMYRVLNLVLSRRLVNITGPSGMGRSSLAVALCHYINERKSTMMFEHIYFVRSTSKRKGRSSPITSLCEQIDSTTNRRGSIPTNLDLDETVDIILRALRKSKTLLVFERIETLEGADAQDFQFFLGQIFAETKDVHVLISSDKSLGLLQLTGVGEDMYKLGPLKFRSTVKLFAFCCPHLHSSLERKELVDLLAPETDIPGDDESRGNEVTEKIKSMLGDGIPARILSAAYQMTVDEFNELKRLRL